ncbi:MAG TPA: UDP-N-acetylglucosamine 2-epimerase (non-hydrolyzing) [Trueperaceae bacterium]|nr:UDP-N-acetylglucosamine 2-epimerase (non-hydrolyzing) [Trueperaceae bacterium]
MSESAPAGRVSEPRRAARVCVAFGTRPEAHKMAPVVRALEARDGLEPVTLVTGQHRQQLDASLRIFDLVPHADLRVMTERQSLPDLMARIVPAAAAKLRELACDYVLVHGDTLTTFAVALAAFFEGRPVAHVEAGLRSFDLSQPFPEEGNRRLTDVLTDLDLPPTERAKRNLLREGKREDAMVVTGNTAVDAVRLSLAKAALPRELPPGPVVAITMHRRENLPVMASLAAALARVARAHPQHTFVYPVHLNPAVQGAVTPALGAEPNVVLDAPWDFLGMLALLSRSELVVTDSGGIQEEGAALGVPVAVLRNVTERPEGVEAGVLKLVGNDPAVVESEVNALLDDAGRLQAMRSVPNPYGDGHAGERVAAAVAWRLGLGERPEDWRPGPAPARDEVAPGG